MADDIVLKNGAGADFTAAADEIAGKLYQRIKAGIGADGSYTDPLGGAGPVAPGVQRFTLASDDVAVALLTLMLAKIIAAPATEAKQDTANTALTAIAGYVDGLEGFVDGLEAKDFATQVTLAAVLAKLIAAPATEAKQDTTLVRLGTIAKPVEGKYKTVAASQTASVLGTTGAIGDFLSHILVIPANAVPGAVTLLDNATSMPLFAGGASSISNLIPFVIPLHMASISGAWKITTGADVSCIAMGSFT